MRSQFRNGILLSIVFIVALSIGLSGGIVLDRRLAPPDTASAQASISTVGTSNYDLINQAWNIIKKYYVDHTADTDQNLTYGAIDGMVTALGDTGHSRFETPAQVKQEHALTTGHFDGIGAKVKQGTNGVEIMYPIDGSPAQKAGLLPGDIITKVDGNDMTGLQLSDVLSHILGPAGTQVTVTIARPSTGETLSFTITRTQINIQSVSWIQIPGTMIADLRIDSFSSGVTKDLQNAITQIKQQHLTGIILDLRNNPGGLLDESVSTASQFLSSGSVLQTKDATGKVQTIPVQKGGVATQIPMVVLINGGTASAAEIVAGALQDNHHAQLVGDITFGTGTILNEFPLSDGSSILLATQEWLTPDGHTIWHTGITPDVKVTMANTVTPLFPQSMRSMTAAQFQASGDVQMLQGLKILTEQIQKQTSDLPVAVGP